MPALFPTSLLHTLVNRAVTNTTTSNPLQVICAFPVSGQYGPGSRILYYVLIATCVFARKEEWLKGACLVAALIFPAVAALHGIVLAAVHIKGAVDMDVFGAFQLCSIGILAGPVTVRLSKTYFNDPGRNAIFLWTGLVLAGLLSLTVEFFRIKLETSPCPFDDSGNPMTTNPSLFPYNDSPSCGLVCNTTTGPFSPLRGGSTNNIYVIPIPHRLTFGTATLIAAACCLPAILSLVFMWNKILEINGRKRFGNRNKENEEKSIDEAMGVASPEKMKGVNSLIRLFLSAVEVPVFGAAVMTIVILGEWNFWSQQVNWQTEPMASVGQWAPIVGTGLALLGSLYMYIAKGPVKVPKDELDPNASPHHCHCDCSTPENHIGKYAASMHSVATPITTDLRHIFSNDERRTSMDIVPTTTHNEIMPTTTHTTVGQSDAGNRVKVANALAKIGNYIGTPAQDRFDLSEFKHGKALDWPEIPGEEQRNSKLTKTRETYNQKREELPVERPSRAPSIIGSEVSGLERRSTTPRASSPHPLLSPHSSSPSTFQLPHASTFSVGRRSSELQNDISPSRAGSPGPRLKQRRDTLKVPHHSHARSSLSTSTIPIVATPESPVSPSIIISSDAEPSSSSHAPVFDTETPP